VDNPDIDDVRIAEDEKFDTAFEKDLLGGIVSIKAAEGGNYIPYYAWDNREAGKMKVWVDLR
jgi:hypothetical protein